MHGQGYDATLKEFKSIVIELTFATKSFFFLMLGYWTDLSYMADWRAWALAVAMIVTIYLSRALILRLLRQPDWQVLTWLAPRGLITVLLFLTAMETGELGAFPFGTVMLVVLATATATVFAHRRPTESGQPETADVPQPPDAAPVEAVSQEPSKSG
jgi:NhaP-type Na+/H+ or K+/H+ antiporter